MTLVEIENKVKEIQIKLYGENYQLAKKNKNGKRKFIASVHLRKFLLEELRILENKKTLVKHLKVNIWEIEWNNVFFDNKKIKVKYGNIYSEEYYFEFSRSSFEMLKSFIALQIFRPLKVSIYDNKIISISNLEDLFNVFNFLTLKSEIITYFNNEESKSFSKIFSLIHKFDNKDIVDFYRILEHSDYLEYLCQKQAKDYKIIPATEIAISNQNTVTEDDAFLFTVNSNGTMYIIWESVLINKATYIFQTNKLNYFKDLQFIFDFIVSHNEKKRFLLSSLIEDKNNRFNLVCKLIHTTKEDWIDRLCGLGN